MKPYELTIGQAADLLHRRELTSQELTRSVLERIHAIENRVGAFITILDEPAMTQAAAADALISEGKGGPLIGIPLGIKDLICTQGVRTTCASRMLENFIPPYDATVMQKLKAAGAVTVGKLNMDEFAMGASTENSAFKPTHNPWDLNRIPGGSSGGSAAAVAADMCLGSLGSDTGGSIRQPSSHCGVVGMKPTYGRVSRFGLVAFASSLDQIGPITKDTRDCALLMNVIAGHDPMDSTSVPESVPDYTSFLNGDLKGMVAGIPKEYHTSQGLDPEVSGCVRQAIQTLEALGVRCEEVSLPHTAYAVAAYYVIAPCEASSNLARYDGVKYGFRDSDSDSLIDMYRNTRSRGFGPEVQRRILLGTYSLSSGYYDAYYGKASRVRTLIMDDFKKAFQRCDLLVSPVAPTPAYPIGQHIGDPLTMYLSDIFTLSANLAGIPGMSVPCGFTKQGLPVGLQLMGPHFSEGNLLKAAWCFEQSTDFHTRKAVL